MLPHDELVVTSIQVRRKTGPNLLSYGTVRCATIWQTFEKWSDQPNSMLLYPLGITLFKSEFMAFW